MTEEVRKKPPVGAFRKHVRIILEENENIPPTGLFLGVNGRGYILRPGEPVLVPPALIEVLNNAVESKPVIDPTTRRPVSYRDSMRYPYREVREPVAA